MLTLKFEKAVVYARKVHTMDIVVAAEHQMELFKKFSERLKEEMDRLTSTFPGEWSFLIKEAKVMIYQTSTDPYGKGDVGHNAPFTAGAYYIDNKRDW